jgi:hypothetical protein
MKRVYDMRDWTFWEWMAYGMIAVSVVVTAIEQWRKRHPRGPNLPPTRIPKFFGGPIWALLPPAFLVIGTGIFLLREIGATDQRPPARRSLTVSVNLTKITYGVNLNNPTNIPLSEINDACRNRLSCDYKYSTDSWNGKYKDPAIGKVKQVEVVYNCGPNNAEHSILFPVLLTGTFHFDCAANPPRAWSTG